MLITINVNNTLTQVGLYDGAALRSQARLHTDADRTLDEYELLLRGLFATWGVTAGAVHAAAIASVVPSLDERIAGSCLRCFGAAPLMVGPGVRTGAAILVENPREVGADRICNVVAAYERFRGPAIVVDFDTATTLDVVTERGDYAGSLIVPGVGISLDAMIRRTSKLPSVEIAWPAHAVGRNTVAAVQSGITFGSAALVDGLVRKVREEVRGDGRVIATGGYAHVIGSHCETVEVIDELLTLDGIRLIHQRNAGADR